MIARGSHNIILINSFNKFSIKLTLIQYPLSVDKIDTKKKMQKHFVILLIVSFIRG
jgi:hypothetical protein